MNRKQFRKELEEAVFKQEKSQEDNDYLAALAEVSGKSLNEIKKIASNIKKGKSKKNSNRIWKKIRTFKYERFMVLLPAVGVLIIGGLISIFRSPDTAIEKEPDTLITVTTEVTTDVSTEDDTARVNSEDAAKSIDLIKAVQEGNLSLCEYLIKDGAPSGYAGGKTTPLHVAAKSGEIEIADLLIANGADILDGFRFFDGYTALDSSYENNNPGVQRLLAETMAETAPDDSPISTLWKMGIPFSYHKFLDEISNENTETIELFLNADTGDYENLWDIWLLTLVCRVGNIDHVKLFLSRADHMTSNALNMALHGTSLSGELESMKLLLEAGANPDVIPDSMHTSALGSAFIKDKSTNKLNTEEIALQIVELLLEYGADPNFPSQSRYQPLYLARSLAYNKVVQVLKKGGAEYSIEDTTISQAILEQDATLVKELLNTGIDPDTAVSYMGSAQFVTLITVAFFESTIDIIDILLASGADIDKRNGRSPNSLERAFHSNRIDLMKLILQKGADPNMQNGNENLLDMAAEEGNYDVVSLLLKYGAVSARGAVPYYLIGDQKGFKTEIAEALTNSGIKVTDR